MAGTLDIEWTRDALEAHYGQSQQPLTEDLFELLLLENVVYLADDDRRSAAFRALRQQVGTTPEAILAASSATLIPITSAGILPELQIEKLRRIADIATAEFGGDLDVLRRIPLAQAKRRLRKFPSIGEPGAEKILLLSRSHPVFAVDSNGLRVLLRLGYGEEGNNYGASYHSAMAAVRPELQQDFDWLISLHLLLREHGQRLCRRNQPQCGICPLAARCRYNLAHREEP